MPKRFQPSLLLKLALPMLFFAICDRNALAQSDDRLALVKVPPSYPALARQMHVSGRVKVTATVDASGKVTHAESDSQVMLLVPAAIEAVKQWKFKPADAASTVTVFVNFALGA
jgi:TonB family protein